ncbi:MAG: disulfide bond formation protein B [Pseudomonadota bacterium]
MSVYGRILLAGLGSALMLLGAFGFQYIGEFDPCVMCLWQRWPHAVAIVVSVLAMTALYRWRRPLSVLGMIAVSSGTAIAGWHVGVEQGLWDGPGSCSAAMDPASMTTEDLLASIEAADLVRCDEVVWDLFGISMAGWNALISTGLALLWLFAALPKTTTPFKVPS